MLSGEHTPEEIVASVEDGLYAEHFAGGQVDITSGDFVFTMSGARRIRKGRLAEPVRGATLIGRGDRALLGIRLVGNDSTTASGSAARTDKTVPSARACRPFASIPSPWAAPKRDAYNQTNFSYPRVPTCSNPSS